MREAINDGTTYIVNIFWSLSLDGASQPYVMTIQQAQPQTKKISSSLEIQANFRRK